MLMLSSTAIFSTTFGIMTKDCMLKKEAASGTSHFWLDWDVSSILKMNTFSLKGGLLSYQLALPSLRCKLNSYTAGVEHADMHYLFNVEDQASGNWTCHLDGLYYTAG